MQFKRITKYIFVLIIGLFFMNSCSDDKSGLSDDTTEILPETSAGYLIKIVDSDTTRIKALARMLDTSSDSIDEIIHDKILPNESLCRRIDLLYSDYMYNGKSYCRLRNDNDPNYHWFEYVLDYPWLHPWWFWSSVILVVLLCFVGYGLIAIGIGILIYIVAWIFSLFAVSGEIMNSNLAVKGQIELQEKRIQYSNNAKASRFIDERRIYLIDLTRSMEGFNGSEDIFNLLKSQLYEAINEMNDTTAEIVLIPFTDHPHEIFKNTISNKEEIIEYIRKLQTRHGDTNILDAWKKGEEMLDSTRINYMFMLTDGVHNSGESIDSLYTTLRNWHNKAVGKYQFAFYVLLSQVAREQDICNIVDSAKQMWLVPSMNIHTDFILGKMNLTVNIRDYNHVRLHLACTNPQIFNAGFRFKMSIPKNEFYRITHASERLDKDGNIEFEIEKLKPQKDLPISYKTQLLIDYDKIKFPFVFFTPEEYNLDIVNVGTRSMTIKQVTEK